MKRTFIALLVTLISCFALSADDEYYYVFLLSCGKEQSFTADHELDGDELMDAYEKLDAQYCKGTGTFENEIK